MCLYCVVYKREALNTPSYPFYWRKITVEVSLIWWQTRLISYILHDSVFHFGHIGKTRTVIAIQHTSCVPYQIIFGLNWSLTIVQWFLPIHLVLPPLTWFFPFSVRILVTLPKGKPRAMTSVSEASLGSFLMWSTRDGGASSTLSFLLSLPLEAPSKKW